MKDTLPTSHMLGGKGRWPEIEIERSSMKVGMSSYEICDPARDIRAQVYSQWVLLYGMSIQNIILHIGDDCVGKAIIRTSTIAAARKELKPE